MGRICDTLLLASYTRTSSTPGAFEITTSMSSSASIAAYSDPGPPLIVTG